MFASRSLLSVNLLLRESIRSYVKSKPLFQFQKYKFWHDFSYELKMDARKGRDIDRKKRKSITQTWRAVSTQPICSGGDGARERIQDQMEDVHHAVSSTGSVAKHETSYSVVPNVLIGPDVLIMEGGRVDASLDENAVPSEKHSVSMEIGASLMRFIKGKGGGTQEKIEEETGVKIIFPSSKKEDSITIEGNSAESIAQASEKIQSVIDKAVNSRELDYSHFVSLPLAIHPELVDKLVNFQNTILGVASSDKDKNINSDTDGDTSNEEGEDQDSTAPKVSVEFEVEKTDAQVELNLISDQNSAKTHIVEEIKAEDTDTHIKVNITNIPLVSYRPKESKTSPVETSSSKLIESGIEKSIFIKPKTFHLTVLMLKLWNKERVKTAAEVLQSVSSKVLDALDNQPIMIRLKGLDCMRGSLAKARVLYAPVEEIGGEGRLLRACKVITDAFIEAGLVMEKDAQQQLKLHATLMNARHRKRKKRTKKADSFDARGIFDKYGGEAWGEYPIREAHLSQRFAFDENGYYHCCASIPFPENMQLD